MNDGRVAKRRWEWKPDGRRPVGRPRKRWTDSVSDNLQKNNMPTLEQLRRDNNLHNRDDWRKRVARLTEI